jgi:hypothetical protein
MMGSKECENGAFCEELLDQLHSIRPDRQSDSKLMLSSGCPCEQNYLQLPKRYGVFFCMIANEHI